VQCIVTAALDYQEHRVSDHKPADHPMPDPETGPVPPGRGEGATASPSGFSGRFVYRRGVDIESELADDDHLRVTGRLRDERPGPEGGTVVIHHMSLALVVRISDLEIVGATADMSSFPHAECPLIAPRFADLVGLPVRKGFAKELNRRLGGVAGCSHLVEIARSIAPVVTQSMLTGQAPVRRDPAEPAPPPRLPLGSCHLWSPEGVAVRKLRAGWIPGTVPHPVPPLRAFTGRKDTGPADRRLV